MEGALLARELHAQGNYHFDLVPGIELTTRSGHLLALWVDEPLPTLRPLEESVAAVHRAGGLAVAPHPFSWLTRSIGQRALERVLASEDPAVHPDGIEVANPTLAGRVTGAKARRLNAERYGLAETGGSDAHFLEHVGSATTQFEGRTAADLRLAIEQRRCSGVTHGAPGLRALGVRRLAEQQVRGPCRHARARSSASAGGGCGRWRGDEDSARLPLRLGHPRRRQQAHRAALGALRGLRPRADHPRARPATRWRIHASA